MAWTRTYLHNVLVGLDAWGAAVFFNRNDVTISTMCRIVQLYDAKDADAVAVVTHMNLHDWQIGVLRRLAVGLNEIQPNHCELARQGDIERAQRILALLEKAAGDTHVD